MSSIKLSSLGGIFKYMGSILLTSLPMILLLATPSTAIPATTPDEAPLIPVKTQSVLVEQFRESYFAPWNDGPQADPMEDLLGWYRKILDSPLVGPNLQPVDREKKEGLIQIAVASQRTRQMALALRRSDLRVLPSQEPMFEPPGRDKVSFPFDRLQNGTVNPMEPLLIAARWDGWLFVITPWASGWIREDVVAPVDQETARIIKEAPLGVITKDTSSVRYSSGAMAFTADIGTLIPLHQDGSPLLPLWNPLEGKLDLVRGKADDRTLSPFPLTATPTALESLARSFLGQPYGWGGMYGQRDCSATTRDALIPFGIWMPRNSSAQGALKGLDLSNLSRPQKTMAIVQRGVPFLTVLYMRGHVMLYAGHAQGVPVVIHNLWSVKSNGTDRVIGRCVMTDLRLGDVPLIDKITKIVFPFDMQAHHAIIKR